MDDTKSIRGAQHRVRELAAFHEIGKALTSTLNLNQVLQIIMEKISSMFHPDTWSLLLLDERTGELYFEIAIGAGAETLKEVRLKPGEGIAGWVASRCEPLVLADVYADERFAPRMDELTKLQTHSVVCVPVTCQGKVLGVIELVNCLGTFETDGEDLFRLQALADYAAIALQNARYVQQIHEMTITDDCTSLYNSRYLHSVLESEIYRSSRYHYEFSLLFMDIDYFKKVNDKHGHLAGSKLLEELGQVIKGRLRMIDFAFRYGGDEFVVLLPQTSKAAALMVARRVHRMIGRHIFLREDGLNVSITASFGVSTYPEDGTTRVDLIRQADQAMYLVKNTSRDGIALANQGMAVL